MEGESCFIVSYESNPDEWISAEKIRKELGISPYDFCKLLDTNDLQTDREREQQEYWSQPNYSQSPFFNECEIDTLSIHVSYYRSYCEKLGMESTLIPKPKFNPPKPDNSLYPLVLAENKRLNIQNEELKARIVELEEQKSAIAKPASNSPATGKDYSEKIPLIVKGVFASLEKWNSLDENDPRRINGFTEDQVKEYSGIEKPRTLVRALKAALADSGQVGIKQGRGTTKSG